MDTPQVTLRRYEPVPGVVRVYGKEYACTLNHDIVLVTVDEPHRDYLLGVARQCCGGSKKPMFTLATEDDIKRHRGE